MAARPRKREYRHLPEYLLFDKDRGVYKFTLITGKKKNLGKDRAMAIAIAREYNLRMRPLNAPSVELLIRESGGVTGEAKPFAAHVDHIMQRAIENERPSPNTLDDWNNDALRVKEFFNSIPSCDIELEHVNAYIKHFHSDFSANVQNRKVSFLKNCSHMRSMNHLCLITLLPEKKCEELRRRNASVFRSITLKPSGGPPPPGYAPRWI